MRTYKRILAWALVLTLLSANIPWTAAAAATEITELNIQVSDYQVGDQIPTPDKIDVGVDIGIVKEVLGFEWENPGDTFKENTKYLLFVTIEAPEGKTFSKDLYIESNKNPSWSYNAEQTELDVCLTYDFNPPRVEYLEFDNIPEVIAPGAAPALDPLVRGNAKISDVRWVDSNKQTVTDFVDGKVYYMEITLQPTDGYAFLDTVDLDDGLVDSWDIVSKEQLLVYICYSLEPVIDSFEVTVSGVEVGKSIADVKVQATGDVVVDSVWVYDSDVWEQLESGSFEKNRSYRVGMEIFPGEGYVFSRDTKISVAEADGQNGWQHIFQKKSITVFVDYDFNPPRATEVYLSELPESIKPGSARIPSLEVEGKAKITGTRWVDTNKQAVTNFSDGKAYFLEVTLEPAAGYEFRDYVYTNGYDLEIVSKNQLVIYYFYSLFADVGTVNISIAGVEVGKSVDDIDPVTDGNVVVKEVSISDLAVEDYVQGVDFEKDHSYEVRLVVDAAEGYKFTDDTQINANGCNNFGWHYDSEGATAYLFLYYDFRMPAVEQIEIEGLPHKREVTAGAAPIPELSIGGDVQLTGTRWVDAEKHAVTSLDEGKIYYLELTFAPEDGYVFREYVGFWSEYEPDDYEIVDENQVVAYFCYSLVPGTGYIQLETFGYGEGTPVGVMDLTITGKAQLDRITVYDALTDEEITSGKYEHGRIYRIVIHLTPQTGYRFDDDTGVSINNEGVNYSYSDDELWVSFYMSTCDLVNTVALNVGAVAVGKSVSGAKVTAPSNANYVVDDYQWIDITNGYSVATGTFQKGHRYYLELRLSSKDGYTFARNVRITLGGKEIDHRSVGDTGMECYVEASYSFLEKITKVELPAMPSSIKKGSTLSTNYKVSSTAKYTLEPMWAIMDEGPVTKVEKNASYVLMYNVSPKNGYEFGEDVVVSVGGKKCNTAIVNSFDIQIYKTYNIGVTEIDHIDLTIPEPVAGEAPGKVTLSAGVLYQLHEQYWFTNTTGTLLDEGEDITKFQDGQNVFLSLVLSAPHGYGFANELDFYINGKKVESSVSISLGTIAQGVVSFGKLGEIEPMKAPVVKTETVDGQQILSWNAGSNATAYEIYRATSKSGKYTLVDTVVGTVWQDTTAAQVKTYYYKVKAINTDIPDYNSGYSNIVSVAYRLSAPMVESANNPSTGKVILSWNKVSGAKKYEIYRSASVDGTYKKLTTVTKTTYTDTKADVGVDYFYKVKAIASSSTYNSEFSQVLCDFAVCASPVLSVKIDANTGMPLLSWNKVAGAKYYTIGWITLGMFGYDFYTQQSETTHLDKDAVIGNPNGYVVVAVGEREGTESEYSNEVIADPTHARPVLKVDVNINGAPVITWDPIEDVDAYEIYRSTKYNKSYSYVETVETPGYIDTTVAAGKTFYYKVVAVGYGGKSAQSEYVKATGKCAIPELDVAAGATGKPVLTWNKISGAKKYEIWRSVDDAAFKRLTTTTKITYTDSKATEGAECTYMVMALGSKSAYNGQFSEEKGCYVTCAAPTLTVTVNTATGNPSLSWKKITGASAYSIYRAIGDGEFAYLTTVETLNYQDADVTADTKYTYYVVAEGKADHFDSLTSTQKGVTATCGQAVLDHKINDAGKPVIAWEPVKDAVSYKIYRSTKSTASYKLVAEEIQDVFFQDESVGAGKTYYYKVIAVSANGQGAYSTYEKVTGKCAQPFANALTDAITGKPVITWDKISGAKKYEVWRSVDGETFTKLATVKKTTYTDTKAAVGQTYFYQVRAMGSKSGYNSIFSMAVACDTTCGQPVLTVKADAASGKPVVSWKSIAGAEEYMIFRAVGDGDFVPVSQSVIGTSFTDDTAVPGVAYRYMVQAGFKHVFGAPGTSKTIVAACSQPNAPTVVLGENNKPELTWDAVQSAESYAIYRSTSKSSGYKQIGTTEALTYNDASAKKSKTYYYKVVAVAGEGMSAQSGYAKIKSK